jgi:hypothetical protein
MVLNKQNESIPWKISSHCSRLSGATIDFKLNLKNTCFKKLLKKIDDS